MKTSLRLASVTLLAGSFGLGGTVLNAAAATADPGLATAGSVTGDHRDFDTCQARHDSAHGSWDSKGRFHDRADRDGWRDDNCTWRSDNDDNGRWHDSNGCEHDRWGWWSNDSRFHWNDGRDDRGNSRSHDDGKDKSGDHGTDHKSPAKPHKD